jgi:hypothetical protein
MIERSYVNRYRFPPPAFFCGRFRDKCDERGAPTRAATPRCDRETEDRTQSVLACGICRQACFRDESRGGKKLTKACFRFRILALQIRLVERRDDVWLFVGRCPRSRSPQCPLSRAQQTGHWLSGRSAFDPLRKSRQLYSASTIIYTDAAKPIGRPATPADVRMCFPTSPKTSIMKSDAPFMAAAWSVHSSVLLIRL